LIGLSNGDVGCLSFHPRESISTGEGGMIITNSEEIDSTIESLRNHGATILRPGKVPEQIWGTSREISDTAGAAPFQ